MSDDGITNQASDNPADNDPIFASGDPTNDTGIHTTYFGYEGDTTGDRRSLAGIGDHDNVMTPGFDVGLNNAARAYFGVTHKGQEFIDHSGVRRRAGDTVPELYSDARMDIYTGRHGGEGKIDTGGATGSELNQAQKRAIALEQAAERPAEGDDPFTAEAMVSRLREAYPDSYKEIDNSKLWQSFSKKYPTPLSQLRAIYPAYDKVNDDALIQKVGQKYFPGQSEDDIRDRLNPPQGIAGVTNTLLKEFGEFAKYAVSQFLPQSSIQLQTTQRGASELMSTSAKANVATVISTLYPEADETAQSGLATGYLAMPKSSRINALNASIRANPETAEKIKKIGGLGDVVTAFDVLSKSQALDKERADITTNIEKTQLANPDDPKLGHTWSTVGKALAGAPVGIALSIVPGVREGSNYAQLYDQNREAIRKNNPNISDKDLDEKARIAAAQQLPVFEVASLLKIGAANAITKGITNKVLRAGVNMATTVGGVTGAMTGQQILQNISSGAPITEGVSDAAIMGFATGGLAAGAHSMMTLPELLMSKGEKSAKAAVVGAMGYQGTHDRAGMLDQHEGALLLHNIQSQGVDALEQMLLNSPSGRVNAGVYPRALEMSEAQARDFLRGAPNRVDETVRDSAVDMFLGALDASKEITGKFDAATREAHRSAIAAQVKGDYGTAKDHLQAVLSSMPDEDKTELGRLLRKNLLNTSGPITAPERQLPTPRFIVTPKQPREFTMVAPPAHEGTIYAPGPKPRLSLEDTKQQTIDDQFFTGESDGEEAMASAYDPEKAMASRRSQSGAVISPLDVAETMASPLPGLRQTIKESKLGKAGDLFKSVFAPGELNEATRTTQAIVRNRQAVRDMENTRNMNAFFRQQDLSDQVQFSVHSDRRDNFWNQFSKQKQKEMLMLHEEGKATGNRKADRLDAIYKAKNRALQRYDESHGIAYPLRESYIYHAVQDEKAIAQVEGILRGKGINPDFMRPREVPTIRELDKLGIKLKSYNRERLEAMRNFSSYNAVMKMDALEDLKDAGLAFHSELLKAMPQEQREQLKAQTTEYTSPRGKYRVQNDATNYLKRMWDPGILETTSGGRLVSALILQPLITMKAKTVGTILSLSGYHHLHQLGIGGALSLTGETRGALENNGSARAIGRALADVATQGAFTHVKAHIEENKVLKFYKGEAQFSGLSEPQKLEVRYQREGGLLPYVDHERQQQFIHKWFSKIPRMLGANDAMMDRGYKIATHTSYQRFLFENLIPSMQMYAFNKQAAELFAVRPELLQPERRIERVKELAKIGKFVEGITGEGAMRNTDLPKVMKTVGQATLLSMSWKMAMIKTYGRGFASLANNAAHMDQIIQTLKKEGAMPAARRVLTNDVLYAAYYTGFSMMGAAIISSLVGVGVKSLWDLFYPNIGTDPSGNLKRVKPPFFSTEIPTISHEGPEAFAGNSLQPFFQTLLQLHANKDYRGTEIRDPMAPLAEQAQSVIGYVLKQLAPISVQSALAPHNDEKDVILSFMGLPRSAAWTTRGWIDDQIVTEYVREHGGGSKSQEAQAKIDAREAYRAALINKDGQAAAKAKQHMIALGVKPQGIHHVEHNANISSGKLLFKTLDEHKQVEMLKRMKQDELTAYLPYASKKAQHEFQQGAHSNTSSRPKQSGSPLLPGGILTPGL
jgi:hypothetical protein